MFFECVKISFSVKYPSKRPAAYDCSSFVYLGLVSTRRMFHPTQSGTYETCLPVSLIERIRKPNAGYDLSIPSTNSHFSFTSRTEPSTTQYLPSVYPTSHARRDRHKYQRIQKKPLHGRIPLSMENTIPRTAVIPFSWKEERWHCRGDSANDDSTLFQCSLLLYAFIMSSFIVYTLVK